MDLELDGKTVLVTGAGRGIGLAIARGFAAAGAHVVAGSRTITDALDDLVKTRSATVLSLDLSQPQAPAELVAAADGHVDILVNNVGAARPRLDGFLAITDEMWHSTLELDLMAAVRAMRAAIPVMLNNDRSVIVNIGSLNARLPDPAVLDYSAAKSALVSVGKSLSKEFGGRGLRVNTVDPGPVATDLFLFLASVRADNITGADFVIDGGM